MTHTIASREDWLEARRALLAAEKAHTRERDALAEQRRALPWVRVEKPYAFDGPDGRETLSELFAGRRQLAVYHFMYGANWEAGCPSCSYWADNLNGIDAHLAHRDTTLVLASTAPLATLEAYKKRMGWDLKWVSSGVSDFNADFGVTFTPEQLDSGDFSYNYRAGGFGGLEAPGLSTFVKDDDETVYHSYSTYRRGLDHFNGAYQLLDLTAKGRDEGGLSYAMAWLKRRDEYAD